MAQVVIPDASVILKWVLNSSDDGDRDNALLLLDFRSRKYNKTEPLEITHHE